MPRKKKEVSEEAFEIEEVQEEVSEIVINTVEVSASPEEISNIINEYLKPKKEYKVTYFLGNDAVVIIRENGQTISRTIPKTKNMKIGDVIIL